MIDRNNSFFKQVELLVRILPFVVEESCFAVKGGTAINLFIRDLPRLSVDVDLVYLPIQDRNTSLTSIEAALKAIASRAENAVKGLRVTPSSLHETGTITKLMVELGSVRVKMEVNPVLRGTLFLLKDFQSRMRLATLLDTPKLRSFLFRICTRVKYAPRSIGNIPGIYLTCAIF